MSGLRKGDKVPYRPNCTDENTAAHNAIFVNNILAKDAGPTKFLAECGRCENCGEDDCLNY